MEDGNMQGCNVAAMRDALAKMTDWMEKHSAIFSVQVNPREDDPDEVERERERERDEVISMARAALAAPSHTGKWENGKNYEYEFAYCSECGRMQWADWGSHEQAKENIESFADDYRFCPGCGARMEGGEYVR